MKVVKWSCNFCGDVFTDFYDYREHMASCLVRKEHFNKVYQLRLLPTDRACTLTEFYDLEG